MKKIALGNGAELDLQKLLDTRLLVQAGSGGGKSYRLRWLLEQSYGEVQQIILDLEGEFHTLREKYDYILIGKDGDVNIEVRGAELLAKKLLELKVSAIIDLYELKQHERIRFVKLFLDAMINAPKSSWHPCLIVIDEGHVFCPQHGDAESSGSVIDLMTRGRKRGYCGVIATQRLSKLHKDAAAETLNKMVGRTGLDIDMKRAAEELGYTTKEQMLSLRQLEPGEFACFGPAISNEIVKIPACKVKTTHPKAGSRQTIGPTAPTARVKKILSALTDLPHQAEEELRTAEDFKRKIRDLQIQLRQQKVTEKVKVEKVFDEKEFERRFKQMRAETQKLYEIKSRESAKAIREGFLKSKKLRAGLNEISKSADALTRFLWDDIVDQVKRDQIKPFTFVMDEAGPLAPGRKVRLPEMPKMPIEPYHKPYLDPRVRKMADTLLQNGEEKMSSAALKMLKAAAAFYPNPVTRVRMGAIAGYSYRSGHFSNTLGQLRRIGYIKDQGDEFVVTDEGLAAAGDFEQVPMDPESLLRYWQGKLESAAGKMLQVIYDEPGLSRQEIGERSGYSASSGHFSNMLGRLRKNGLVKESNGRIELSEVFQGV